MIGVVLTGPFMPESGKRRLARLAAGNARLRLIDFLAEPAALLRRADCVVTMGGYNCVCEALCAGKRALVVPRVRPRVEQWIRAKRFGEMGLLDVLHPDEASAEAVSAWIGACDARPATSARDQIDFGGLERLPAFMMEMLPGAEADRSEEGAAHVA
jgi:predicted glycosyltransferase